MGISLGLVGLGAFGSAFAPLFKSHPLVDQIALCDRETDRMAKFAKDPSFQDKFKSSDAYESFDDICKADLDALVIITQPWLHAPQAIQALETGKHVYSAVPIVSLPDGNEILDWCDKLIKTCRSTGRYYMMGETTYYRPQTMYCRRKSAEGAFGKFVFAEGEYLHDVESGLRNVHRRRASNSGQEWVKKEKTYLKRGVKNGPMHYPTHSTSGPISVMKAHMTKVSAWGYKAPINDDFFVNYAFSNETALFSMSNGATVRICEYRQLAAPEREMFNILGTEGCFYGASGVWGESKWLDREGSTEITLEEMREPLPEEVEKAFFQCSKDSDVYGGHGGSHAYLVHEFVDAVAHERIPAINAWEAVRYMVPGVMAHKSALRNGECLDVPDWGDAPK